MVKISLWQLKGTCFQEPLDEQVGSFIPAERQGNQPRTHIGVGTANRGTSTVTCLYSSPSVQTRLRFGCG